MNPDYSLRKRTRIRGPSFGFNNRKNPHFFRDTLTQLLQTAPLPFEKLTAKNA